MKKTFVLIAAFAAAMLCSCSKETLTENNESGSSAVQVPSKGGIPASFTVGAPDLGEEETDGEETKVVGIAGTTSYSFQWKKGDKIAIFAYKLNTTQKKDIIDCGDFVAQNDGTTATFTGTLPDTLKTLKWTAVYALANAGDSRTCSYSSKDRYLINNVFLNPDQDGDGFKYARYAGTGWTLEYDTNDNPSFKTVTAMKLSDPVFKFDLNGIGTGNSIYKMVIRSEYSRSYSSQYLAGSNIDYATNSSLVNSGGNVKTVTIYNGGNPLPTTVYAATRHTVGQSKYGYATLYIYCYYKDSGNNDKMDVKTIDLATFKTEGQKTDTTFIKTSGGTIWPLPAFPELKSKTIITWGGDGSATITAPSGSSYKAFPYADNSSTTSIKYIYDGEGGSKITPTSGKYIFAPVRNYVFKSAPMENVLEIGAIENSEGVPSASAYYHYPKSYQYMRVANSYIKIPAKEGYRLSKVKAAVDNNYSAGTTTDNFKICSDKGLTPVEGASMIIDRDHPADLSFSSTTENTAYYMCVLGNRFLIHFTFEYVPVE